MNQNVTKITVKNGFEYIREICARGKNFRLKAFVELSPEEKKSLLCETFAKHYARVCNAAMAGLRVEENDGEITFTKKVRVEIKGQNPRKMEVEDSVQVEVTVLRLTNPRIVNNSAVEYTVNVSENSREELLAKVSEEEVKYLREFTAAISDKEVAKANPGDDFWGRKMPTVMEYRQNDSQLLGDFFDVLHWHNVTDAIGSEVIHLKEIFQAIPKTFPLFQDLSNYDKVRLINNAYNRGRKVEARTRDINLFAKATFEALEAEGFHKIVNVRGRRLELFKEYRHDRYIGDKCYGKNELKFMDYKHTVASGWLRECVCPFDLWHSLVLERYV